MKLLFFDIDGTLLSEKTRTVPESCIQALKKAQENGHLVFINTGRSRSSLDSRMTSLNVDGYICGCGCYIECHQKVLMHSKLSEAIKQETVKRLRQYKVPGVLEGVNYCYFDKENTHPIIKAVKEDYGSHGFDVSKTWDDKDLDFDKLTVWLDENSDEQGFIQAMANDFTIIDRGPLFYELPQKNHSKASGIQFLLDYFHLTIDDAYAFGDSTNDLSMLTYVNNSIGMGNGQKEVLDQVSFITKDVDDDGIEFALKHFKLI